MRKLLIAIALALASTAVVQAQIFSATVRYRLQTPTSEEYCNTHQPVYCVDSKKICKCDLAANQWMCELSTLDKLILGGFNSSTGEVCVTNGEIEGRAFLDVSTCDGSDTLSIPRFLLPPKYAEATLPICDAALAGVRVYLEAEIGVIAARYASCLGRRDGSGFDWILSHELGNTEAPL
jgi:hypothetical protein